MAREELGGLSCVVTCRMYVKKVREHPGRSVDLVDYPPILVKLIGKEREAKAIHCMSIKQRDDDN